MAKFTDINGEAKKSNVDYYKFSEGKNKFRIFGDVLPRYVYWVKGQNDKNVAMECLSFDRDEEKFTNVERDYVQEKFPDLKCSWAYLVNAICLDEGENKGKVQVLALKKKLFQQILELAREHLGDPTDPVEGWDITVIRKKTGPLSFNVEYTLDQLACKNRALSPEEKEAIESAKSIEELFPRPTPEEQKAFLDKLAGETEEEDPEEEEVAEEDAPF